MKWYDRVTQMQSSAKPAATALYEQALIVAGEFCLDIAKLRLYLNAREKLYCDPVMHP